MASPQIEDFIKQCPSMPPRMPAEALPSAREATDKLCIEKYPALPGVETESVQWNDVNAVWYHPKTATPDNVILYVHGGGFMWSSAYSHCGVISRIADKTNISTLALEYKLAPEHRFPVQLNEGISLYRSLLEKGYNNSKIALVGDSAGGGLVMSMMLACKQQGLPLPACAAITSSWADLTNSGESIDWVSVDPNVSREGLEICLENYLTKEQDPKDPLISPLFGDFENLPPLLIQAGSRERLLSDSTRLAAKADAAGVDVKLEIYDGCVHLFHWWVPDAPETAAAIGSISEFVLKHTA